MKFLGFSFSFLILLVNSSFAQESLGGIPWSKSRANEQYISGIVPSKLVLEAPNFEEIIAKEDEDISKGIAKPYMMAKFVYVDIDIFNSGNLTYLPDGSRIWKLNVSIPGSKSLDCFYDRFQLPEGVRFYLHNANDKQLIGAFSNYNNNENNLFVTEPIQGNEMFLELNIDPTVDLSTIRFHINKIGAYYREFEYLNYYSDNSDVLLDLDAERPTESPCHVNAVCPPGLDYLIPMEASARVLVQNSEGVGSCSGSLINNTSGDCKPLFLTASHCDGSNSFNDADFAQWRFRFRDQSVNCDNYSPNRTAVWVEGATFKARSYFPSMPGGSNPSCVGDFLLVELSSKPSYATLAGWNRNTAIGDFEQEPDYNFFIGFHHPGGTPKRLVVSNIVDPTGTFNQVAVPFTHWRISAVSGGSEPGSSGSPLFDHRGRIVGDLSGGPSATGECAPMGYQGLYSKISYAWENTYDQIRSDYGPKYRLKDHLDPIASNSITCGSVDSSCAALSVENTTRNDLENSIHIYPNPSSGDLFIMSNYIGSEDFLLKIYNILGKEVGQYTIKNLNSNNQYKLDLTSLIPGNYLIHMSSLNKSFTRKIVIKP